MYKYKPSGKGLIKRSPQYEGEPIEAKVRRLLQNKEAIKEEKPLIYTERKDGVVSGYNIRTDRWEVATDAMDLVTRNKIAQREGKIDPKVIKHPNSEAESTDGKLENESK